MSDRHTTRRRMLQGLAVGAAGLAAGRAGAQEQSAPQSVPGVLGAESPAAEAAAISPDTIANAERLFAVRYTDEERAMMVEEIDQWIDRMVRLRQVDKPNTLAPASIFDPRLPGVAYREQGNMVTLSGRAAGSLPGNDTDIAFAPVWKQAEWIRSRQITSRRLTDIYLARIAQHGPRLECFVTVTADIARREADAADAEIAAGRYRGPLHGIPYGMKDIIDVAGVRGTWGATPWRDRIAEHDAVVTTRLREAGAVLLGKTTNGAIAYGDRWFGGITRNPFNTDEGSSGSSAGSASATAAGLVGFGIGTETLGSIVSPSHRCGTTGLRPTFGRVPREGAMALCWSLDKVGPICRRVEDAAYVLAAIDGVDPRDAATRGVPLNLEMTGPVGGLRVGYFEDEYEGRSASDADRETLTVLRRVGVELVPKSAPSGDWGSVIGLVIDVEAACAFDELTRSDRDDLMVRQQDSAWPNLFRASRLIPAVEALQASRVRRRGMALCRDLFADVEVVIAPQRHGTMHALTNLTGNPAVTLRQAFREDGTPRAATLWGRVHGDANLLRVAARLEDELGLWMRRPDLA